MAFLCYRLRWIKSENLNFSIAASRTPPGYLDFGQAMAEHVTANPKSRCLLRLRYEFNNFPTFFRWNPLSTLAKSARDIELDYLSHNPASNFTATSDRVNSTGPLPLVADTLHKRSFLRRTLHTALIHIEHLHS
jgi:hypothetical protein